uniref:Apple domain-containing protein n=1 Tax=Clytia hemisphaerica TaxID=252671 RepID=A0A7M6DJY8_9CNID
MITSTMILLIAALQLNNAFGDTTGQPNGEPTGPPVPQSTRQRTTLTVISTRRTTAGPGTTAPLPPTCKLDYNMNYFGCNIGFSIRPSWEECAEACQKHKRCFFWVYEPSIKRCYYKNRNAMSD